MMLAMTSSFHLERGHHSSTANRYLQLHPSIDFSFPGLLCFLSSNTALNAFYDYKHHRHHGQTCNPGNWIGVCYEIERCNSQGDLCDDGPIQER
mmetsp:Transcript_12750/g.17824  ORF Transcript_12750/g.17824 Transcript_12750/m.17824 type:complete len:94 (+) Transcript_12750:202-483(+)